MPSSAVLRLIDLVNYQEGAVVSRTLMKRATGTITLFAFEEGQGLSEHTTPFDALAQVLRGGRKFQCPVIHSRPPRASRFSCPQTNLTL